MQQSLCTQATKEFHKNGIFLEVKFLISSTKVYLSNERITVHSVLLLEHNHFALAKLLTVASSTCFT